MKKKKTLFKATKWGLFCLHGFDGCCAIFLPTKNSIADIREYSSYTHSKCTHTHIYLYIYIHGIGDINGRYNIKLGVNWTSALLVKFIVLGIIITSSYSYIPLLCR